MQKKILNAILLCAFLVTGCEIAISNATPTTDQMDKSPFTGIPCAAPCWYELEIGKSNESDVISTIQTLTFIDQNSVYTHHMLSMSTYDDPQVFAEGIEVRANCINTENQCVTVQVVKDILTEISIVLNYQIKVDETIKYLGNPTYVGFDRAGGERIACRVFLIWNEKKLVLESKIFEGINAAEKNCFTIEDTGKVSANLLVSEVKYLPTSAIDRLRTSGASWFYDFSGTSPK
jgi:hypothetical protein